MLLAFAAPPAGDLVLIDFAAGAPAWRAINDGVMGGRSHGEMIVEDGRAVFRGSLSLENSGGFASVRSRPERRDLSGFSGLRLRVRGDGRTYRLRLRTDDRLDGVSYQVEFATRAGRWIEIVVPFTAFEPVFRGRPVPGHPALDPSRIRTIGLLIADGVPGPFRLEVAWVAGESPGG
ncbi:MAG: CIA30 family protein [Acidobacteria bacterium]|nr:MAG: CIA30 family protein [Acidobacteriota bacterium]